MKNTIKKELKNPNGIFSTKFGIGLADVTHFADRYKCNCGMLKGRLYSGLTCPKCGTKVKYLVDTEEKRSLKKWEIRNFINRYYEILKVSEQCGSMIEDLFSNLNLDSRNGDEPILNEIMLLLETRSENIDNTIKQHLLLNEMIKKVEGMNGK